MKKGFLRSKKSNCSAFGTINAGSKPAEIIEFTLKSLQATVPMSDFKYIKSRKALERKTKQFVFTFSL